MKKRTAGFLLAAIVPVALIFAVACSDDADSESGASQSSIDELSARVQRNEQMAAVLEMNKLGLHDMDESLAAGTIESSFAPNTRTAIRVLALTNWDEDLREDAEDVKTHAVDLLAALEDENIPEAARHAKEFHELGHDFTDAVWAKLAADLPADAGGVEPHDDEGEGEEGGHSDDEETPEAEATP